MCSFSLMGVHRSLSYVHSKALMNFQFEYCPFHPFYKRIYLHEKNEHILYFCFDFGMLSYLLFSAKCEYAISPADDLLFKVPLIFSLFRCFFFTEFCFDLSQQFGYRFLRPVRPLPSYSGEWISTGELSAM